MDYDAGTDSEAGAGSATGDERRGSMSRLSRFQGR